MWSGRRAAWRIPTGSYRPRQDDMVDSDEEGDGKKQEEKRAQARIR